MRGLARFARSMLAQTILLSLLFLGSGVYLFAVRPVLDYPAMDPPDPRDTTLTQAESVFDSVISSSPSAQAVARHVGRDPFMRELARRNPGFRWAVIVGDTRVGTASSARYRELGLERLTAARAAADPGVCVQMQRLFTTGERGIVNYLNCGEPRYYELSGIVHPVPIDQPSLIETYMRLMWSYSRDFLLPALGVFGVCAAILGFNIVMILRVARVIRTSDGDKIQPMPERGLPEEVRPLVRAVNRMIVEVTEMEERQRFFLSAAAHEMRTPLTVLRTRLELLDDGEAKDKLIVDVRRLTRLVNELLTLMRIRVRTDAFDAVDLATCCTHVIAVLTPVAATRGVRLELETPLSSPSIAGDAALVEVAITNLVDNAIAFAPDNSAVSITVDAEGGVTVRDGGRGIPAGHAQMLFEPFVRFSKHPGGYGLGLTIVKAVADLHGAVASAENAPAGGAQFSLRFPPR